MVYYNQNKLNKFVMATNYIQFATTNISSLFFIIMLLISFLFTVCASTFIDEQLFERVRSTLQKNSSIHALNSVTTLSTDNAVVG